MTPPRQLEDKSRCKSAVGAEHADESGCDDRVSDVQSEACDGAGRIKFSTKKLYGRDRELETLHKMYSFLCNGFSKDTHRFTSLFLAGYSGCGKSALMKEFTNQLTKQNLPHILLTGKFEEVQRYSPFSAIIDSFGRWCSSLPEETLYKYSYVQRELEETIGADARILVDIVPELGRVVLGMRGESDSCSEITMSTRMSRASTNQGKLKMERVKFVFQRLLQSLSVKDHPLILFVDDMQWADDQSLELISELLTSNKYMFVGSYRSNEVAESHKLEKVMVDAKKKNHVGCIELSDLSKGDCGEFIADSLKLDVQEVFPLTEAIFKKTFGNAFFVKQSLEELIRKNALYYDTITSRWSWKLDKGGLEALMTDDIIEMVKSKIRILSKKAQKVLIIASYTRATFDLDILLLLTGGKGLPAPKESIKGDVARKGYTAGFSPAKEKLYTTLLEAVHEGLLVHEAGSQEFTFAHDRIQEGAANLVCGLERDRLLVYVGKQLASRGFTDDDGEDWMLFTAAHHLNSVPSQGKDIGIARLNSATAGLAKIKLAFPRASEYVQNGLKSLPPDSWTTHFGLTLELYSTGAEVEKALGNVDLAESYCHEVLKQTEGTTMEKIAALKVLLDILAGRQDTEEALNMSLDVLRELGCKFPRKAAVQRLQAMSTLSKTKSNYIPQADYIESMPFNDDIPLIQTMELMEKAGSFAYTLNKIPLYILLRCKWIKWMYKFGLTDLSGSALASFGNIVMHVFGDFEMGKNLAELSMLVQERLRNKFTSTRTLNTANMNVLGWVEPLHTRLKYHLEAYEAGMASGNIEGAFVGRMFSYWVQIYAAMPLQALEADCRKHIPLMREMGHNMYGDLCSLIWQTALNLMGWSENTFVLTGEAMDEAEYIKKSFKHSIAVRKSFVYALFGEYELGAEDALERGDSYTKAFVGAGYGFEPFYRGICLYAMLRKTKNEKYSKAASETRKQLIQWAEKGCVNLAPLVCLLEAEHEAISGSSEKAKVLYDLSITTANRQCFHQNAGLACERYAEYLTTVGDTIAASDQLRAAIGHYEKWGATRKVELLQESLSKAPYK